MQYLECEKEMRIIAVMVLFLFIPDSVVELRKKFFSKYESLWCVTFRSSSKLERICSEAFCETRIGSLSIQDSVAELR